MNAHLHKLVGSHTGPLFLSLLFTNECQQVRIGDGLIWQGGYPGFLVFYDSWWTDGRILPDLRVLVIQVMGWRSINARWFFTIISRMRLKIGLAFFSFSGAKTNWRKHIRQNQYPGSFTCAMRCTILSLIRAPIKIFLYWFSGFLKLVSTAVRNTV